MVFELSVRQKNAMLLATWLTGQALGVPRRGPHILSSDLPLSRVY